MKGAEWLVKVKKYLVMFVILFMTLSSLAIINISVKPAQAAPFWDLTVQSTPFVGIDFTINGTSYTTNDTVNLDHGFYTVSMPSTWINGTDQYTFMKWEDNSTNPVRIVSLTVDKTIIAYYRHVKVYVNQPGGYIPGELVGQKVTVDIIIEVSGIDDDSLDGIVGWGFYVRVDPDVLNITKAIGKTSGYFLWEFADWYWYPYPTLYQYFDATAGYGDVSEFISPPPLGGAGDSYSGFKLVTLEFTSKSETAYSKIDLIDIEYMTPDGKWHDVDEVIDGHYNEYIPHDLTVESTPIDGINFTASMHAYDSTTYTTNTTVILPEGNRTVTMPDPWVVGSDQYNFVEWEDTSTDPVRTINLTSNITIIANYERALKKYNLTVNSLPITGVNFTIDIDPTIYVTNTSINLWEGDHTVTMPSTWMVGTNKYIFRHWEDTSTDPERVISLTSNITINATYGLEKKYILTVNSLPITGVNFEIGSKTYATNTSVSLLEGFHTVKIFSTKMVGADRYIFKRWEDNSTSPQRTISLTSNKTITATYEVSYVKVYVNQPLGYIPGQPSGQTVTADIIIEVTNITDNSPRGIVGWRMDVQVDPDVLNITQASGATSGYFLWNFSNNYFYNPPELFQGTINTTSGYWEDLEETVVSAGGAGDGSSYPTSSNKLVTLEFTSKSATAYSKIDLIDVYYMTGSTWYPVDEVIDGHYNEYIPHDLTVESTPIAGINFTIDSPTYTTNTTVNLLEPYTTNTSVILPEGPYTVNISSTWMVGADRYDFVEWEDNSTNPVRTMNLTSNITITATYALVHVLTVESTPMNGINFTIDTTTYTTNTSVMLLEGPYTVSMPSTWMNGTDQYSFVEWEDSSTNPVRVVSLTSNTTIIATYGRAPVASFIFSPDEPIVADTVTFNASASDDPDGTIVTYAWEFGDGDSDTGVIAEHAYEAAGDYNVTLTVTDNDGLTHTITKTITIKEAPPSGIPLELILIAAAVIVVIIIAIVVYYLKIMKHKPA